MYNLLRAGTELLTVAGWLQVDELQDLPQPIAIPAPREIIQWAVGGGRRGRRVGPLRCRDGQGSSIPVSILQVLEDVEKVHCLP